MGLTSWVYVSPHLDDAVLSAGARIYKQIAAGDAVAVFTLCAGDPPRSQAWGVSPERRRVEDRTACTRLGASFKHFEFLDAPDRLDPLSGRLRYPTPRYFMSGIRDEAEERAWVELWNNVAREIPANAQVVFPLGLGGHVDHRFTRWLGEQHQGPCWFYADVPYVLRVAPDNLAAMIPEGAVARTVPIKRSELETWSAAIEDYRSQLRALWRDAQTLRRSLAAFVERMGGHTLWQWRGCE
jgi:LmbE family N-acetylglucosaminyl deacetylase